jgi:peptidoglycan/xylan/chitin deacetylase (PgdA/CDA1 family)
MKTQFKLKNSLLIYEEKRKPASSSKRFLFGLILTVIFITLPVFKNFPQCEKFIDAGFSQRTSFMISRLKKDEINFITKNLLNVNLERLIEVAIDDIKLDENDKKLLKLVNLTYGSNLLKEDEVKFLYELKKLPNFEKFFSENIELKFLSKIKPDPDLISEVEIEIYKLNSDKIPILMYHMLDVPYKWIDEETFKAHLKKLTDNGFTTISIDEFLECNFSSVPEERKPIIITFDDAFESQFRILKNGEVDPNTEVGMLEENYKLHPEFGKKAAFFIYLNKIPFGQANQPELWLKKIKYLYENGYNIGCHTYSHINLSRISPERINKELNNFYAEMEETFGERGFKESMFLAYPDGDTPRDIKIIKDYKYKEYGFDGCFSAWGWLAPLPFSSEFDRYKIPRIEANNETISEILKEETFKKETMKIKLPKIYTLNEELFKSWINKNKNKFISGKFLYKGTSLVIK